jgi:replicative DNA helicase
MNTRPNPTEYQHLDRSAVEVEAALIGGVHDERVRDCPRQRVVSAEHFKEDLHQALWTAMTEMSAAGQPVDPLTLVLGNPQFPHRGSLRQYVARCAGDTHYPSAYVVGRAKHVRKLWALRQVAARGEVVAMHAALLPGADLKILISDLVADLDQTRAVIEGRPVAGRMVGEATDAVLDRMNRIMTGEMVEVSMATRLTGLDRKRGGGIKPVEVIREVVS